MAEKKYFNIWMSEISKVEMIQGKEKQALTAEKKKDIRLKDESKLSIAQQIGVIWLDYPCSVFDDDYSRFDLTFKLDGNPNIKILENSLERVDGVSIGDARQIVSCLYGNCDNRLAQDGISIKWFISEDKRLIKSINKVLSEGKFKELDNLHFVSVDQFISIIKFQGSGEPITVSGSLTA